MKRFILWASVTAATLIASPAFAQSECAADADCPDGFTCETSTYDICTDCAPGSDCTGECETRTESHCAPPPPASCDENTPCDGDDVCVTFTFEECSGGGSTPARPPCDEDPDPDDPCLDELEPEEDPTECTTTVESYCVPPYLAPCSTDADCGAGFTCEDVEICQCSGGAPSDGGIDGSDGGDGSDGDGSDSEADCSCEPTGDSYCELVKTTCTADADCTADLTCQDFPGEPATVACAPDEECTEPEPTEPESYCAPPGFVHWGGPYVGDGGGYGDSVAVATGHDEAETRSSEREEFFPVDGDSDSSGSKESPSACSSVGASGSAGGMLLFLFGLVAMRFGRSSRGRSERN